MGQRILLIGILSISVILSLGCGKHRCCRNESSVAGLPPLPPPTTTTIPPKNLIPPANIPPSNYNSRPPEVLLPSNPSSSSEKPIYVQPYRPNVTESTPKSNGNTNPEGDPLLPSGTTPPSSPPKPISGSVKSDLSLLPTGIADFAQVKENVTTGLKPDQSGLEWLKSHGYRTIVHLRKANEEDLDRNFVEKQGFVYRSLEVSPALVNQNLVDEFNKIVDNESGRPVFVYDRDGSISGNMWYLYFRTSEFRNNDVSIIRARGLGLKENGSTEQQNLFLAIQKYLSTRE